MSLHFNSNNTVKKVKSIYANVNGEMKKIKSAWVNRNGSPAKVYGSAPDNLMIFSQITTKGSGQTFSKSNHYVFTEDGESWYGIGEDQICPDREEASIYLFIKNLYGRSPIYSHGYFVSCFVDYQGSSGGVYTPSYPKFNIIISEDCIDWDIIVSVDSYFVVSGSSVDSWNLFGMELVEDTIIGYYPNSSDECTQFSLTWNDLTKQFDFNTLRVGPYDGSEGGPPICYPEYGYSFDTSISFSNNTEDKLKFGIQFIVNRRKRPSVPVKFGNKYVVAQSKAFLQNRPGTTTYANWINNSGFLVSDTANNYPYTEYSENPVQNPGYSLSSLFGKLKFGNKEILITTWSDSSNNIILSYCDSLDANDITPILFNGNDIKVIEYVSGTASGQVANIVLSNIFELDGRYFVYYRTFNGYTKNGYKAITTDKTYELQYVNGILSVKREITTPIVSCVKFKGNVYLNNGSKIMKVTNWGSDADLSVVQACPNTVQNYITSNMYSINDDYMGVVKS